MLFHKNTEIRGFYKVIYKKINEGEYLCELFLLIETDQDEVLLYQKLFYDMLFGRMDEEAVSDSVVGFSFQTFRFLQLPIHVVIEFILML